MLKRVAMTFALVVLAACGGVQEDENVTQPPAVEGAEAVGTVESDLTLCGTVCPSNYYPSAYGCSLSCGSCGFGAINQVTCQPYATSFTQCGTVCPSGWYPSAYGCSLSCGSCGFGAINQATCVRYTTTFTQCGTVCPSGWRATSYSCSLSCGSCGFGALNQATCVRI